MNMDERLTRVAEMLREADPLALDNLHADWARQSVARTLGPLLADWRAEDEARVLREVADDPALRLSGHSGVSIRRLRDRAAQARRQSKTSE